MLGNLPADRFNSGAAFVNGDKCVGAHNDRARDAKCNRAPDGTHWKLTSAGLAVMAIGLAVALQKDRATESSDVLPTEIGPNAMR
jgi:hypothetical protein